MNTPDNRSRLSWLLQIRLELMKLFARPRTYIGFAIFLPFELLILGLLQLPRAQAAYRELLENNGYLFAEFFTGPTMAFAIVSTSTFLLGSLFLSLVAGDIVAKEVEDGTMRMMLNRPASRLRILSVKALSCLTYTILLILFIAATSLILSCLYRGWGNLFVYVPTQQLFAIFPSGQGFFRFSLGSLILALSLTTISAIGFFFSCLPIKPAAATILTLSVCFADFVLSSLPFFVEYRQWFLTYHFGCWIQVFKSPLPWASIVESLVLLWTLNLTLFALSALVFTQRDFKS